MGILSFLAWSIRVVSNHYLLSNNNLNLKTSLSNRSRFEERQKRSAFSWTRIGFGLETAIDLDNSQAIWLNNYFYPWDTHKTHVRLIWDSYESHVTLTLDSCTKHLRLMWRDKDETHVIPKWGSREIHDHPMWNPRKTHVRPMWYPRKTHVIPT